MSQETTTKNVAKTPQINKAQSTALECLTLL